MVRGGHESGALIGLMPVSEEGDRSQFLSFSQAKKRPCENTSRRQPSTSQESFLQKPNGLPPVYWTSQPPEL